MSDTPTRARPPLGDPTAGQAADGITRDLDRPTTAPTTPASSSPRNALPPNTERYTFVEELARGGMGVIYRATDAALNREVAVKVLQDRFGPTSAAAGRFVDEARVTAQLQHPAIPAVHDLGVLPDGSPFLVMKLIKGRTLDDLLMARPNPTHERGRFSAIFEQVCQAVGFAHDRRVIHRDLKPTNVMVGGFGEVQVMDWGLAKLLTGRSSRPGEPRPEATAVTEIRTAREADGSYTQTGSVLGTPAFMPPEQAGGEIDKIDERSDVFSLGAILAVILTGKPPYLGADIEAVRLMAVRGQLADCFARLDACEAEPGLVGLCKRCLAFDPSQRPPNAEVVAREVAGLRSAAEVRAREAELERAKAEAEVREQRKRRYVQLALAGAVGLLLAAGAGFAWWQDKERSARRSEEENRSREEQTRQERNAGAVSALLDQGEDALQADNADKAAVALGAAEKQAAEGGADKWADRLAQCRADLALLRDLDRIDESLWIELEQERTRQGRLPMPNGAFPVTEEWRKALARYGIIPGTTPLEEAVRRVNASRIKDRLLAALDAWLAQSASGDVFAVLRVADPNPYRNAFRAALVARDDTRVAELVAQPEALDQPGRFAVGLGLMRSVSLERREQLLVAALARRPGDFGVLMTLAEGVTLGLVWTDTDEDGWIDELDETGYATPILEKPKRTPSPKERWLRAALVVRPTSALAHSLLGDVLRGRGDGAGATAEYKEAIRLNPQDRSPRLSLARTYHAKGEFDAAVSAYHEMLAVSSDKPEVHCGLGDVLFAKEDYDGAATAYKAAIRIAPGHQAYRLALGRALHAKRDLNGAIASFREATRLQQKDLVFPDDGLAHLGLGKALYDKGEFADAILSFEKAVAYSPRSSVAHHHLGLARRDTGDLDGAIDAFKEVVRLNRNPAVDTRNLLQTERWRELRPRLADLASRRDEPKGAIELCDFAQLSLQPFEKRYLLAVRLYENGFAAETGLAAERRYDAASAAALALAGKDAGRTRFGWDEWGYLSDLAREWLRKELTVWASKSRQPKNWPEVRRTLGHWKSDADLVGVRDQAWLAEMPSRDRALWEQFWAEVEGVLKSTRPETAPTAKPKG